MMNSKRNQTIAIARFLMYKHSLNQQLDGMTDEEYLADPIGLDVGSYVKDLMRYCPENVVDQVMEPAPAEPRTVNIETVGWGSEGQRALYEIADFLADCGIGVHCWIPSAPVERLITAPRRPAQSGQESALGQADERAL